MTSDQNDFSNVNQNFALFSADICFQVEKKILQLEIFFSSVDQFCQAQPLEKTKIPLFSRGIINLALQTKLQFNDHYQITD